MRERVLVTKAERVWEPRLKGGVRKRRCETGRGMKTDGNALEREGLS